MSPDLALKPDIGAPGGFIRSTFPLALGGYANLSGTSMSSPHVAGGAALYLEAHPKTHAWDMRDLLQNSAVPKNWFGNPGLGLLDSTYRQGAGMLRIDTAITATAHAKPGKLSLGESQNGPVAQSITLTNESHEERVLYYQITYSLCDVPDDAGRFCAQFRRVNPLPKGDVVTILDGVQGRGQYVGTYCAWASTAAAGGERAR